MSEPRHWAVLFTHGDLGQHGSYTVAVTDGEQSPHSKEAVRTVIEAQYGPIELCCAVGPMASKENAQAYVHAAATPAGLDAWLRLAKAQQS